MVRAFLDPEAGLLNHLLQICLALCQLFFRRIRPRFFQLVANLQILIQLGEIGNHLFVAFVVCNLHDAVTVPLIVGDFTIAVLLPIGIQLVGEPVVHRFATEHAEHIIIICGALRKASPGVGKEKDST